MISDIIYDYFIVGLGPAGIGFINSIESITPFKIAVADSGDRMDRRNCKVLSGGKCNNCNLYQCKMIYGEGGASLLGGHKISCFPAGTFLNNILLREKQDMNYYSSLLEKLARVINLTSIDTDVDKIEYAKDFYAELGYKFKHYDSYLCSVNSLSAGYKILLKNLSKHDVFFETKILDCIRYNDFFEIYAETKKVKRYFKTKNIIFAVGLSGNDLLLSLNKSLSLNGKPNHLEVGVRIEFPSEIFEDIDKFHNDLKIYRDDVRTFCVSKKGKLSPYFCDGLHIVDGFFDVNKPTKYTNLALMYRLDSNLSQTVLSYIKKSLKSDSTPIIQSYRSIDLGIDDDLLRDYDSSISFLRHGNFRDIYPDFVSDKLIAEIKYFVQSFFKPEDYNKINIISPSLEYFWLDFPIDDNFKVAENIYMIGDCSGKYRGILQAFVAGAVLGFRLSNNSNINYDEN